MNSDGWPTIISCNQKRKVLHLIMSPPVLTFLLRRVYHAHETTASDPFAIALLCGDLRVDVSPPSSSYI